MSYKYCQITSDLPKPFANIDISVFCLNRHEKDANKTIESFLDTEDYRHTYVA